MRVIQLAKRLVEDDWGGAETVVLETSKHLLSRGHNSEVFCTLATAKSEYDEIQGVHVKRFPYFYTYMGLTSDAREALDRKGGSPFSFQLLRALKQYERLDLIHLHALGRLGSLGSYAARKRRIPYVVSLHGGVFDVPPKESASWSAPRENTWDWGKPLGWWYGARRVLLDADAVICVGYPESLLAQQQLPEKRILYLPNGVEVQRLANGDGEAFRALHSIPAEAIVLLTVGRIDVQKNQLLLIKNLERLKSLDRRAHIVIVGPYTNAEYASELTTLARNSFHSDSVTIVPGLPGGSRALADAYHAADVFVLPSTHEPFGIVVLEAWSAGLPVIASRVGGIPHFVDDGVDGVLFDPANADSFIEAFQEVTSSADRAKDLARRGYEKAVRDYTWDAITDRLIRLYEEVMNERSVRK